MAFPSLLNTAKQTYAVNSQPIVQGPKIDPNKVTQYFNGQGYNAAGDPIKGATTTVTSNNPGQGNTGQDQLTGSSGSSSGSSRSSGSAAPAIDWSSVAEANDLISQAQNQLGRLPGQADIFNSNLATQYGKYRSQLQEAFNRNKGDYTDNRLKTSQAQERTNQQIRSGAGNQMNALARYLNSIGAGDTMAARGIVPYGVAREAQQQSNEANQTYGENFANLDKSWNRYNTDYSNSWNDLADQESAARKKFQIDQLNAQQSANDNLRRGQSALEYAKTGNAAQARAIREAALPEMFRILQQIDALGKQDVTANVKDASYVAPELQQYEYQDGQNVQGVDQSTASDTSPWLQYLLKMRENDNNAFGY